MSDWLGDWASPEALWLGLGVVLVLSELLTLTIVLGMLGVGALVAGVLALLGLDPVFQLLGFTAASTALLVFVRPPVKAALDRGGSTGRTDARMLQGATALVVQRVSDDSGQVRLNGELWRARPYAGTGPVEVGQPVSVAAVEGATLMIYSTDLS